MAALAARCAAELGPQMGRPSLSPRRFWGEPPRIANGRETRLAGHARSALAGRAGLRRPVAVLVDGRPVHCRGGSSGRAAGLVAVLHVAQRPSAARETDSVLAQSFRY